MLLSMTRTNRRTQNNTRKKRLRSRKFLMKWLISSLTQVTYPEILSLSRIPQTLLVKSSDSSTKAGPLTLAISHLQALKNSAAFQRLKRKYMQMTPWAMIQRKKLEKWKIAKAFFNNLGEIPMKIL